MQEKISNNLKILAGWLIDGKSDKITKNVLITIKDGYFFEIKQAKDLYLNQSDIIDLSNFTILPCLIDCHVHLFMSGTSDDNIRKNQLNTTFDETKKVISKNIEANLSNGIIAVRDGGDSSDHVLNYKLQFLNEKKTPIILHSAKAFYRKDRYGRLFGTPLEENKRLDDIFSEKKHSFDHIKIINSGINSLVEFGKETAPQFSQEELIDTVKTAKNWGLKAMIHANGKIPVEYSILSKCSSIEHGFFMGDTNLKKMAEQNIFWVPTAFTMKALIKHLNESDQKNDVIKKNLDHQLEQIYKAKKFGTPIALGTDAGCLGVNHGKAVIEELKLFVEAGFSIQESIKHASSNAAKLLGLNNDIGSIRKGIQAFFIAVLSGPENLPESLNNIELIYVKDKLFFS